MGAVRHLAKWRDLAEHAAAVGELRELAAGRTDLLAEVAGIVEGASEAKLDEPRARQAAGLCRKAGADPEAILAWIEEGRRRRAVARMPPFSGGVRQTRTGVVLLRAGRSLITGRYTEPVLSGASLPKRN
jgi:ParB-like chromosome segregation protein Spo0J